MQKKKAQSKNRLSFGRSYETTNLMRIFRIFCGSVKRIPFAQSCLELLIAFPIQPKR